MRRKVGFSGHRIILILILILIIIFSGAFNNINAVNSFSSIIDLS